MQKALLFLIMLALPAVAQNAKSDSVSFNQQDVESMVRYLRGGSVPALADSAVLSSLQTLRGKLDGIVAGKLKFKDLNLTPNESSVMLYMMSDDIKSAVAILQLREKLAKVVNKK